MYESRKFIRVWTFVLLLGLTVGMAHADGGSTDGMKHHHPRPATGRRGVLSAHGLQRNDWYIAAVPLGRTAHPTFRIGRSILRRKTNDLRNATARHDKTIRLERNQQAV